MNTIDDIKLTKLYEDVLRQRAKKVSQILIPNLKEYLK